MTDKLTVYAHFLAVSAQGILANPKTKPFHTEERNKRFAAQVADEAEIMAKALMCKYTIYQAEILNKLGEK